MTGKPSQGGYLNNAIQSLLKGLAVMTFAGELDENWHPTLTDVGKNCKKITGFSRHDLLEPGDNAIEKLALKNDFTSFRASYFKTMELGTPYSLIYRLKTSSGRIKWVFEHGIPEKILPKDKAINRKRIKGILCEVKKQRLMSFMALKKTRLFSFPTKKDPLDSILSASKSMEPIYSFIRKAAQSDSSVIITGETGTGKDLLAKAIHDLGTGQGNYVPVNCTAISPELIESEFFGYKKGAFSGAAKENPGFLATANKGTLFLDEVGDISLPMQTKLLRAIDSQCFMPVGANREQHSEFRLITATNKDLASLVRKNKFRSDFFYRIHVLNVHLPPLREREEDITLLADYFLARHTQNKQTSLPNDIYQVLKTHHWPGNIRELQNVIERYVTLGTLVFSSLEFDFESPVPLPQEKQTVGPAPKPLSNKVTRVNQTLEAYMHQAEKKFIQAELKSRDMDMHKTAEDLGISLRTLQRKIKAHDLRQ